MGSRPWLLPLPHLQVLLVGKLPGIQNMYGLAQRTFVARLTNSRGSSRAAEIEAIVDEYMMVNSSLVDNEFNGADLPSRLSFVPS